MIIERKTVSSLTPEEYKVCYNLNMRSGGVMRDYIRKYRHGLVNQPVILVKEDNIIVAWALITTYGGAQFYVRKKFRRKGIGSRLMNEVLSLQESPKVEPWDHKSRKFFANFNSKIEYSPYLYANQHLDDTGLPVLPSEYTPVPEW